ncbi:hypothetical protein SG34_023895 [Thalassomonas viridans]|uniref:Uncharacterized protein n=1 Tax=Thalassomonas viridans TaxID=137584 RepID=A0AAE9Z378_9GAMM|nr:hypothetical protein [Thalassomonas viridans]WDE04352.1 hypothetical protein SG34_023895 [Thalassomonas viridans]
MQKLFIPDSFEAPRFLETNYFHFRVLDDAVAQLDYEAVMASQKRLKGIFGPESDWPESDMTIEENIASLKVHKQEFESREAFAYSVFSDSKSTCLGSVYIDPSQSPNYECEVYLWVRDDSVTLDKELYQTVLNWLQEHWPFSKVAFPGRNITWKDWAKEPPVAGLLSPL